MNKQVLVNAKNKWEALEAREQQSLKILGVALVLFLAYFLLWVPAQSYMKDSERLLQERADLLGLVQSSRAILASQSNSTQGSGAILNSQQLVSTVTNLAKKQQLSLKRFEPSGENKVKVWVEDVSFDVLVSWLSALETSVSVKVEQISVEKQDKPGVVSARLTLTS
jgi:general secretion pathway protein M